MALGIEKIEWIVVTIHKSDGGGNGIERYRGDFRAVHAAEIDDLLAVDEDPDVVIPAEVEDLVLALLIGELGMELQGEAVVIGRTRGIFRSVGLFRTEGRVGLSGV